MGSQALPSRTLMIAIMIGVMRTYITVDARSVHERRNPGSRKLWFFQLTEYRSH
jgi:hypothetical protein